MYNINSSLSMSNGIITVPKNTPSGAVDITWAVPGNNVFFSGAGDVGIADVSRAFLRVAIVALLAPLRGMG